jgi:hypothetical protein
MSAEPLHPPHTSAAAPHSIGRRALVGLGLLGLLSSASAALMYGTLEPDADFAADPDAARRRNMLAGVVSWVASPDVESLDALISNPAGLLVINATVLTAGKISTIEERLERLQTHSDGSRRAVLAALNTSVSGLEPPLAIEAATIDALQARGIEGVVLDCRQTLADARRRGRAALDFLNVAIVDFATRARLVNPNFLLILGNAAELASDPRVNRAIDGVAKENLLFGIDGIGVANSRTDVIAGLHDLHRVKRAGHIVLVTEHLAEDAVDVRKGARQTLDALGFAVRFSAAQQPG